MSTDDFDTTRRPDDAGQHLPAQMRTDASHVAEKAQHELDAVKQRAAEDVRELGHEAKARVGEATDKAKSFANDQKSLAADQINGVADAIGKVADELDGSDQATVARYARDLASGLSSMGRTVEERDVDDLMGMAQDFGRKQPVAFLGAAALAGFVASRFALASAHRRHLKATATQTSTKASAPYGQATAAASGTQSEYGTSYGAPHGQNRMGDQ
jgi:hypothetical protein